MQTVVRTIVYVYVVVCVCVCVCVWARHAYALDVYKPIHTVGTCLLWTKWLPKSYMLSFKLKEIIVFIHVNNRKPLTRDIHLKSALGQRSFAGFSGWTNYRSVS